MIKKKFLGLTALLASFFLANVAKADLIFPGKERDYSEPKFVYNTVSETNGHEFAEMFFGKIFVGLIVVIICLSVAAFLVALSRKNKKRDNKEMKK